VATLNLRKTEGILKNGSTPKGKLGPRRKWGYQERMYEEKDRLAGAKGRLPGVGGSALRTRNTECPIYVSHREEVIEDIQGTEIVYQALKEQTRGKTGQRKEGKPFNMN